MNKQHSEWIDRLSDYLAGDLDPETHRGLEAHLEGCGACRDVFDELQDVIARASSLGDLRPAEDLWPGVRAALGTPAGLAREQDEQVIVLPTARASSEASGPARLTFTRPQLAAAAVVLITVSVITTRSIGSGPGSAVDVADVTPVGEDAVTMVASVPQEAPEALSVELAELEQLLADARSTLDPNTVRVLERNLAVIETAIADSREALALNPDNAFLNEHLERVYERKLAYLRDAARVIEWTD